MTVSTLGEVGQCVFKYILLTTILSLKSFSIFAIVEKAVLCQESIFGLRKNLESTLRRSNVVVIDDFELIAPIYLYSMLDLLKGQKLSKELTIITSSANKEINAPSFFSEKWDNDTFMKWRQLYCQNELDFIPSVNVLLSAKQIQELLSFLFNKDELTNLIKNFYKISLFAPEDSPTKRHEGGWEYNELVKLYIKLNELPFSLVNKIGLTHISRLKRDLDLKDDLCCEFVIEGNILRLSDKFFEDETMIDFYQVLGRIVWLKLDQSARDDFIKISWSNNKIKDKKLFLDDKSQLGVEADFVVHFEKFLSSPKYFESQLVSKFNYFQDIIFAEKTNLIKFALLSNALDKESNVKKIKKFTLKQEVIGDFSKLEFLVANPLGRLLDEDYQIELIYNDKKVELNSKQWVSGMGSIKLLLIVETDGFVSPSKIVINILNIKTKQSYNYEYVQGVK